MKVTFSALFLALSITFASVSATSDQACPRGYALQHISGFHFSSCECINSHHHAVTLNKGCRATPVRDHRGHWSCSAECQHPAPPKPSASHAAGHGGGNHGHGNGGYGNGGYGNGGYGNGGYGDGEHGNGEHGNGEHGNGGYDNGEHGKTGGRGHHGKRRQQIVEFCPSKSLACPIVGPGFGPTDVECVHPEEDLDNCGACGNSCADVAGVKGTACVSGKCEIYSCAPGYKLTAASGVASCEAAL